MVPYASIEICCCCESNYHYKKKKKNYNNYERNPWLFDLEWLTSIITMKVDVYSFEVVLLEILCGWRHLGSSQPKEAMH